MDRVGEIERQDDEVVDELEAGVEAPGMIGSDERRLHVRAYNYWLSLLGGRAYPSVEDLEPDTMGEFGPTSVLLDFTQGMEDPGIAWLGSALREECGVAHGIRTIADVPGRSLLSRLTDHYLQIIANRAPIGFEAEFTDLHGRDTLYRGILMPFSTDDDVIDFVYGVISWKELAAPDLTAGLAEEIAGLDLAGIGIGDGLTGLAAANDAGDDGLQDAGLGIAADLDTRLADAQATARNARVQEGRSRTALYHALGRAHDFALAADSAPDDLARLIAEAGLTAQERAPLTPIVKLVFGADYDKTRVTEYAAVLAFARRHAVPLGALPAFVEGHAGGLKAVVAAERRLRAPGMPIDRGEEARERLRGVEPCATIELETEGDEFVLLIARRSEDGSLGVLAPVEGDPALLERAVRTAAR